MFAGKQGRIVEEHNLLILLNDFPPFLRNALNAEYQRHTLARKSAIRAVALRLSAEPPARPSGDAISAKFDTFDQSIESLASMFVQSRYFFENLLQPEWSIIVYPKDAIAAVISTLDEIFLQYRQGAFVGQT